MPQDLKEIIKERLDLEDFLQHKGFNWSKSGSISKTLCMFHDEKTPSFTLSRDKKRFKCFGCNQSGDVFDFLMSYEKLTFTDSIKQLSSYLSIDYDESSFINMKEKNKKIDLIKKEVHEVNKIANSYFQKQLTNNTSENSKEILLYLKNRGITLEVIKKHHIGYCPDGNLGSLFEYFRSNKTNKRGVKNSNLLIKKENSEEWVDFFRNRTTIAILDQNSNIVGFGGRSTNELQKSKYINSKDSEIFNKSKILYGIDRASEKIKLKSQVVIVEGYFDCISAYEKGYENVIAAMGTQLSIENFENLKNLITYSSDIGEMIFCFDNDEAGHKAAVDSINKLRAHIAINVRKANKKIKVKICFPKSGKDPDEIIRTNPLEWEEMILNSQNFIDFMIDHYTEELLGEKNKDTFKFLEIIMPFIVECSNELQQGNYLKHISKITAIDTDLLKIEVTNNLKSKFRKSGKRLSDNRRIKEVIYNDEMTSEKHFLALLLEFPYLFENVKDVEEFYFSDLHYRSIFNLWKEKNKVIEKDQIKVDLKFIYDDINKYIRKNLIDNPDLSNDIELEKVKNRIAIDYHKRKIQETESRLNEEETLDSKDEHVISSLMKELTDITEKLKLLERAQY